MNQSETQVFISYAKEDWEFAKKLADDLKRSGITPWLSRERLLPGQHWRIEIKQAIKESAYFLALISSNSVNKKGFVQNELKIALDLLDQLPRNQIFIIPARLEDCEPVDERLQDLHWVDLFPSYETGFKKILRVFPPDESYEKDISTSIDDEESLFNNIGGSWFDISQPASEVSERKTIFTPLEGQKLVGQISSIAPGFFEVEIERYGNAIIPRPEVELEICRPEIGDRLALQVREGIPMLQTMAQTLPINEIEYYYGTEVTFYPEYYDPTIGLVVGTVDEDVRAFARLLRGNGDIIIRGYQNATSSNQQGQIIPLPGEPIFIAVVESIYYEGAWGLLLSSELQRKKIHIIRSETSERQNTRQLQISYMFDYLEYQTNFSCKVGATYNDKVIIVNIEKIIVSSVEGISNFPVYRDTDIFWQEGEVINLKNFGVIRERGQLSLYPYFGEIDDVQRNAFYGALLVTKRGPDYCASIHMKSKNQYKRIPVIIDSSNLLEVPPFGSLVPFFSFVSITETVWDEKKKVFRGKMSAVDPTDVNLQKKSVSGWTWYYSKVEQGGQLWGANPSIGIWSPLYPYNHLLNKMGLPVRNLQLLSDCKARFDNDSYFKTEKSSHSYGMHHKGIVTCNNNIYELKIHKGKYSQSLQNVNFVFDENGNFIFDKEGEIIEGQILDIDEYYVCVEIEPGVTGNVSCSEFPNLSNYNVRDTIEVFTSYETDHNNQLVLSKEIADLLRTCEKIQTSYKNKETLSGQVLKKVKGGLLLDLYDFTVFMPASQIDLKPIQDYDALIGSHLEFRVIQFPKKKGRHIVVSQHPVLKEKREEKRRVLIRELEEGQICTGIITNIVEFGVFVNIGGIDGLLHRSEMSWGRTEYPFEFFSIGDEITVKILSVDREKERIELGQKQLTPDPWLNVEEKYPVGSCVTGKVVKFVKFGAFIELEEGITGLVHVSEISVQQVKKPADVLTIDDEIKVKVITVDEEKRRIGLSIKQLQPDPLNDIRKKYPVGINVRRKITEIRDDGLIVTLEEELDGFVPKEKIGLNIVYPAQAFTVGDDIYAKIISNDSWYPVALSINDYLNEQSEETRAEWIKAHPIEHTSSNKAIVNKVAPHKGIHVIDDIGRKGIITRNLLENFQTALVKKDDIIEIFEDGVTAIGDHLRFGMVPDPQKYWETEIQEKYVIGSQVTCKILRIFHCGVFVEIEKNVVGLIELGNLVGSSKKISQVQAQYTIGDYLDLYITAINSEEQKIFLTSTKPFISGQETSSSITEHNIQQDVGGALEHKATSPSGIIPLPKPVEQVKVSGEETREENALEETELAKVTKALPPQESDDISATNTSDFNQIASNESDVSLNIPLPHPVAAKTTHPQESKTRAKKKAQPASAKIIVKSTENPDLETESVQADTEMPEFEQAKIDRVGSGTTMPERQPASPSEAQVSQSIPPLPSITFDDTKNDEGEALASKKRSIPLPKNVEEKPKDDNP